MPSNFFNAQSQDTEKNTVFSTIAQPESSPLLKNIFIAALVGVIALIIVSSLIVAASENSLDENNNLKTKETSSTPKFLLAV